MFVYFEGPDGMIFEYSCGVRIIDDEARYRPRQFPTSYSSLLRMGLETRHRRVRGSGAARVMVAQDAG